MTHTSSRFPNAASIEAACDRNEPESLSLEFKEKTDPSTPVLSKDDRRNIAKSVSALANGSGGYLVYGVRTKNKDGVDYASCLKPISSVKTFESLLRSAIQSFIAPDLKGWSSYVLECEDDSGSGYVVCEVITSPDRPHMCIATGEHTYYRRSFQGDVPMTPLEVREQILALRDADLQVVIRSGGYSQSYVGKWIALRPDISVTIKNSGRIMAKNPFVRIKTSPSMFSRAARGYDIGEFKSEFRDGQILHVGDYIPALSLSYIGRVFIEDIYYALRAGDSTSALNSVKVYCDEDNISDRDGDKNIECDGIEFDILYGAENAVSKSHKVFISAHDLKCFVFGAAKSSLYDNWGGKVPPWLQTREKEVFERSIIEICVP